jgi:hypothetical protein
MIGEMDGRRKLQNNIFLWRAARHANNTPLISLKKEITFPTPFVL